MGGMGSADGRPGDHSPNVGGSVSLKKLLHRSERENRCLRLSVLPFRTANYLALFLGEGGAGAFYEEGDDVEKVAALFVDLALALAARAAFHYLQDAFQLALAAEVLGVGLQSLDEVTGEVFGRYRGLVVGVIERRFHAVPGGAKLVLYRQVHVVGFMRAGFLEYLGDEALRQGGKGQGIPQVGLGVQDPQLYRPELGVRADVPPTEGIVLHRAGLDHQVHVTLECLVVGEGGGETGTREALEDLHPCRLEACVESLPERRVGRESQEDRRLLGETVVGDDRLLRAWDGHVDVLAEDHLALGDPAQRPQDVLVALLVRDLLVPVAGEGMGTRGGERGAAGSGPRANPAAQLAQVLLDFRGRGAGWSFYLHHRLKQLVGDGLVQLSRQPAHDLLDLLHQLTGGRVHDGELLLDPEGVV